MLTIYGIRNCDTMKKAFAWLEAHKVAYTFHDYKKQGADAALLKRAIAEQGWETVLNRKGTTWRQLPESVRATMDDAKALKLALENPSIIRRPMAVQSNAVRFGFNEADFKTLYL